MGLFGFGANPALEEQKIKQKTAASKNKLTSFLQTAANTLEDDEIRDNLMDFRHKIDFYPPCADEKAIGLDERIEEIIRLFVQEMGKVSSDSSGNQNDTERTRSVRLESNRSLFSICYEIIEEQLMDRKTIMAERQLNKKEIADLSEYKRARYLYRQDQRETIEELWNVQFIILDYSIRLEKLLCEKKCLQILMDSELEKAEKEPANSDTYGRRYSSYEKRIAEIVRDEKILHSQIEKNDKLTGIINAADLESMISAKNSADGGKVMEKIKKYSEKFKKLAGGRRKDDQLTQEYFSDFDSVRQSSTPETTTSGNFQAKLEERALSKDAGEAPATGELSSFQKALLERKKNQ